MVGDPSREDAAADALSVLRVDDHGVARDAALVGVAAEGERDSSDLQARVVRTGRRARTISSSYPPAPPPAPAATPPHARPAPRRPATHHRAAKQSTPRR